MGRNAGWQKFERACARDMGTERIPVTGERHGADAENPVFCFQFKLRKVIPSFLFEWLAGIVGTAQRKNKIGVLVLKTPRMRNSEALVMLRWSDWVDLHGVMKMPPETVDPDREAGAEEPRHPSSERTL